MGTETEPTPAFVSAELAAAQLGIEASTLLNLARDNKVPHIRSGRRIVRFNVPEIVAAMRRGPNPIGDIR